MSDPLSLLGPGAEVGKFRDQWHTECPLCNKRKFYWDLTKNVGYCQSTECDLNKMGAIGGVRSVSHLEDIVKGEIKLFSRYSRHYGVKNKTVIDGYGPLEGAALSYWLERGGSKEEARIAKFHNKENKIALMLDNFLTGEQTPYTRALRPKAVWMGEAGFSRASHVFGLAHVTRRSVVVVEGPFDVIGPGLLGYGIATLGGTYSPEQVDLLTNRFDRIFVFGDNDKAGRVFENGLAKDLSYAGKEVISLTKLGIYKGKREGFDPGEFRRNNRKIQKIKELVCQI